MAQPRSKRFRAGPDGPRKRSFPDRIIRSVEPTARSKGFNKRSTEFHKKRMNDETRSNADRLSSAKSVVFDMMATSEQNALEKDMKKQRVKRDKSVNKKGQQ